MATTYDPNVIRPFADRFCRQARAVVAVYTIVGLLAGAAIYVSVPQARAEVGNVVLAVLIVAGMGIVGFVIGRAKAFSLKLQAQQALCQVSIEENVRRGP